MPARNRSLTESALPAAVGGRPSRLPCDRACAKPARTRSLMMSLSNSAKTESRPAIARPAGVVRSNASVTETNPTPSAVRSCNVDTRSATDRPHRSNRQTRTTSMSRRRAASINRCRIARATAPEPTSLHSSTTVQPRLAAYSPQRPHPHGKRLLIQRRDARIQPGAQHFPVLRDKRSNSAPVSRSEPSTSVC
jgi:hypothetical protein